MGRQSRLIEHLTKEVRRNTDNSEEAEFVLTKVAETLKEEMYDKYEERLLEHPKYGSCCYGKNPDCMTDKYCQDCESRVVCLEKYHGLGLTEEEKRDRYAAALSEANEARE